MVQMGDLQKDVIEKIEWLSEFGKTSDDGITRLLYTAEWSRAQQGLKSLLEQKNL